MILTINGGSSSIKFALYKSENLLTKLLYGEMEGIGSENTTLHSFDTITRRNDSMVVEKSGREEAVTIFIDWLQKKKIFDSVKAIGHRIVYGMHRTEPSAITPGLLDELKQTSAYDTEHMPEEIKLIELLGARYPDLIQIACFDTAFHATMPPVAKMLAIPRRYYEKGIQRYGFHGLSYAYLLQELENIAGKEVANGKVILAHLGNGASIAAVRDGKSMDTSMGFSPSSGLPMGTRSGDIDPGIAWYLMEVEKLSPTQFNHLMNHEAGLLGISEISSDIRRLMALENTDFRAAEAIELFCYQIKKWIGSFAAVLGGLETLIFSGGIGEHSPEVRSETCDNLGFLGIELDEIKNMNNDAVISSDSSKVTVYVIKTDEQLMIARLVYQLINV